MAQEYIQASFNSGEWAPHLWARTDIEKYKSGAALLENFFVDYRGGISTRSGTKYIIRGYKDQFPIRLIPFQAAISVGFELEFGEEYIRFHRNGAPVLEAPIAITGIANSNPCSIAAANAFTTGDIDWVYISGVGGMTELNGKFFIVHAAVATDFTIYDLFGNPVDASAFGVYTGGGTVQRVYTISSPYAAADLALLKFVENVDVLILTHNDYVPYALTFITATNWTLVPIPFGAGISAPTNPFATTNMSGVFTTNYSYVITAVSANGEESEVSTRLDFGPSGDLLIVPGATIIVHWDPVPGAVGYNVYKAVEVHSNPVPQGCAYGFIGFATGTSLADSNITADFSQPPPTHNNPFASGSEVTAVVVTAPGSYTAAPTMTFSSPPAGVTATGTPLLNVVTLTSIAAGGSGYVANDTINLSNGVILNVDTVGGGGDVTAASILNAGSASTLPANPVAQVSTDGVGINATFNLAWGVYDAVITEAGEGYLSAPTITFSAGAATADATIGPASVGNPAVPVFFQQRLGLFAPENTPQTMYFSRPGAYYNFDVSTPTQDDDSITATIVSAQLSNIKAAIPQPGGLIVYTDDSSFLVNGGGGLGTPITPAAITANAQSRVGCNDMPPIVVNFDILSVQSKGSSVRDNTYNFYANVYTGTDISVYSSHLFFGYQLLEWAWAEEPYKIVWAVRNDGALLSLTFIKEQEFTAWTHHYTELTDDGPQGQFKSVGTIVEAATIGYQNFTYFVVARTINGNAVQYIEYFPERATSNLARDYWTVDCGIQYSGPPATTFSGGEFLVGKTCVGLADGVPITPFVMPASGDFTLPDAASKVTIGLKFVCNFQSLYIDTGAPTIQTKQKQIPQITLRVTETLGLKAGTDADNLVTMKDLVVGNIGGMTNERVTDLVTGDARSVINAVWQEKGQVYVRQDQPYPASILGYIPSMTVEGVKG